MKAYHSLLFVSCSLTLFTGALTARADEPEVTATESPTTAREPEPAVSDGRSWYGWQTLTVDGLALGLMIASGPARSKDLLNAGMLTYALGPALVHAAHGRWGVALGDSVLRVGAPFVLGVVGWQLASGDSSCKTSRCLGNLGGAELGAFIGYAAAVAIDASLMAYEPARPETRRQSAQRFQWAPSVGVTAKGASAGVSGTF